MSRSTPTRRSSPPPRSLRATPGTPPSPTTSSPTSLANTTGNDTGDDTTGDDTTGDAGSSGAGSAQPATVYGDNAYGTGGFHTHLRGSGIESRCKTQAPNAPGGRFGKDRFAIDLTAGTV